MVFLKYDGYFSDKKKKFSAGFYILIALCLVIVGGAAWVALSNYEKGQTNPEIEKNQEEYKDNNSSYIENEPINPNYNEEVAEKLENEPYPTEEQKQAVPESITFTMPIEGEIIKDFSDSVLQYSKTYNDMRLHLGVDIACNQGDSVHAVGDGTVISCEESGQYGMTVTINHKNGITVKYSALKNLKVKNGDTVLMGDIIGFVSTVPCECSDKDHIHIEVIKDSNSVNPLDALGLK